MRAPCLATAALLALGCRTRGAPPAPDAGATAQRAPAGSAARGASAARPAVRALERATLPAGKLTVGTLPGDEGRDPRTEPIAFEATLAEFSIDRLPYPNDPSLPPRTGVSRDEAAALCADRGQRLCTELEWERACRGPRGAYAAGATWDAACARDPLACPSAAGVYALGALREWTASDAAFEPDAPARPVVRGARADADAADHRCAHRAAFDAKGRSAELGLRCCSGPANAATIAPPKSLPAVRRVTLEPKALDALVAAVPQLARVGSPVRLFAEPDDAEAVRKRGGDADLAGFALTASPLVWNPAGSDEVLVVAGRGKRDAFVAAFWRLPDDSYRLASSMVFADDLGPFVLGYQSWLRDKLLWSSCWKCLGEGGTVALRDGRRVVVTQD